MHVFQTAGDPPSRGRTILPIIGWTRNRRLALKKSVTAKRKGKGIPPAEGAGGKVALVQ
jgi:hypothetical protein